MDQLVNCLAIEQEFNHVAKQAFDFVDLDKSGSIDFNELKNCMNVISANINAKPPTEEEVNLVMIRLDTDMSGKLEFEEFKVFVREIMEEMYKSG